MKKVPCYRTHSAREMETHQIFWDCLQSQCTPTLSWRNVKENVTGKTLRSLKFDLYNFQHQAVKC